jgi:hypothetical protein
MCRLNTAGPDQENTFPQIMHPKVYEESITILFLTAYLGK